MDNRLAQLQLEYTKKEAIADTDDNAVLFKTSLTNDKVTVSDAVTMTATQAANEKWGGTGITPGWFWGAGVWN